MLYITTVGKVKTLYRWPEISFTLVSHRVVACLFVCFNRMFKCHKLAVIHCYFSLHLLLTSLIFQEGGRDFCLYSGTWMSPSSLLCTGFNYTGRRKHHKFQLLLYNLTLDLTEVQEQLPSPLQFFWKHHSYGRGRWKKWRWVQTAKINFHLWVWVSHLFQTHKVLVHRFSYASYLHVILGCGWHLLGDESINTGLSNCSCTCCHQTGGQWRCSLEGWDNAKDQSNLVKYMEGQSVFCMDGFLEHSHVLITDTFPHTSK